MSCPLRPLHFASLHPQATYMARRFGTACSDATRPISVPSPFNVRPLPSFDIQRYRITNSILKSAGAPLRKKDLIHETFDDPHKRRPQFPCPQSPPLRALLKRTVRKPTAILNFTHALHGACGFKKTTTGRVNHPSSSHASHRIAQ